MTTGDSVPRYTLARLRLYGFPDDGSTVARLATYAEKVAEALDGGMAEVFDSSTYPGLRPRLTQRAVGKAQHALNEIEHTLQREWEDVRDSLAHLAEPDRLDAGRASAVWNALAGMDRQARRALVADAMRQGDRETLSAVVSAPAVLKLLDNADDHAQAVDALGRCKNPELYATVQRRREQMAMLKPALEHVRSIAAAAERWTDRDYAAHAADTAMRVRIADGSRERLTVRATA